MKSIENQEEKGIKIIYKNGLSDWYSPCNEIIIDNGFYQYKIKVDEIKVIEFTKGVQNE